MDAALELFVRVAVVVFAYYVAAFAVVMFVKPLWLIPRISFSVAFLGATALSVSYVRDHAARPAFLALFILGALALWYAVGRVRYHEGLLASIPKEGGRAGKDASAIGDEKSSGS